MAIKIVDADISELRKAPRGRRSRSPEMEALVQAIAGLKPGQAKAVIPEGGETIARVRGRVSYAARAADRKVRIVTDASRVMFALRAGSRGGRGTASREGAAERKAIVQRKALELGKRSSNGITASDVISALEADRTDLGVARPGTMVGAVLRSMREFERTGHNQFKYTG